MNDAYTTVFGSSYFSNGILVWNFGYLAAGVVFVILAIRSRRPKSRQQKVSVSFIGIWATFWFLASGVWLYSNLHQGRQYTAALANNQCQIVEGAVQVLH